MDIHVDMVFHGYRGRMSPTSQGWLTRKNGLQTILLSVTKEHVKIIIRLFSKCDKGTRKDGFETVFEV
jgi:hypothetical protein